MTKLQELTRWYESLRPESLNEIGRLYHEQARFADPFNQVVGHTAIKAIFEHMFETTTTPGFTITEAQQVDRTAWVEWRFECSVRGRGVLIDGCSRLRMGDDGRVMEHRDYWDSGELYQELPVVGTIVGILKRRLSVPGYGTA